MASELINQVTSDKLKERDWAKSIEICELVACDPGKAKDVIKALKKRLKHKHPNTQLHAVLLLEMLMNNCGEHIHKQVIDNELLPILVKIVKKKTDFPVRERIFLLLDASQTALGGASGKFPQYYAAYYDLVSSGVQFPQHHRVTISEIPVPRTQAKSVPPQNAHVQGCENGEKKADAQLIPDSSIIQKASSIMEVLSDALNALDPKHPEGATDVFILDLVEQCSFQKQRVMHLVMTSRDENVIARAIELNEQLEHVLTCHDSLLSVRPTTTTNFLIEEEKEEEDAECLYRRLQKGKACIEDHPEQLTSSFGSTTEEKIHRPLIRPLCIQPSNLHSRPQPLWKNPVNHESTKQQEILIPPQPLWKNLVNHESTKQQEILIPPQPLWKNPVNHESTKQQEILIPPPPAKHIEREKFFKDKGADGSGLTGHVRGLSLYSNGSSSRSGSTDFGEKDPYGFRD